MSIHEFITSPAMVLVVAIAWTIAALNKKGGEAALTLAAIVGFGAIMF